MVLNTNITSLIASESTANTKNRLNNSLTKLSTGFKINNSSDNSSALSIADNLRTESTSVNQAIKNANSTIALLQIADKAMAEQSNILDIVKSKLIQANSDTTSDEGRVAIKKDIDKLLNQLDMIASSTNYNGIQLISNKEADAANETLNFQIGANNFDLASLGQIKSNTYILGPEYKTVTLDATFKTETNTSTNTTTNTITYSSTQTLNANDRLDLSVIDSNASNIKIDFITPKSTHTVFDLNTGTLEFYSSNSSTYLAAWDSYTQDISFPNNSDLYHVLGSLFKDNTSDGIIDFNDHSRFAVFNTGSTDINLQFRSDEIPSEFFYTGGSYYPQNVTITYDIVTTETTSSTTSSKLQLSDEKTVKIKVGNTLHDLLDLQPNQFDKNQASYYEDRVDNALTLLNEFRTDIGTTQNQIESSVRNLMSQETNLKNAESIIRDVDYALESSKFTKENIVFQAGSYSLTQANEIQKNVLKLLQ